MLASIYSSVQNRHFCSPSSNHLQPIRTTWPSFHLQIQPWRLRCVQEGKLQQVILVLNRSFRRLWSLLCMSPYAATRIKVAVRQRTSFMLIGKPKALQSTQASFNLSDMHHASAIGNEHWDPRISCACPSYAFQREEDLFNFEFPWQCEKCSIILFPIAWSFSSAKYISEALTFSKV